MRNDAADMGANYVWIARSDVLGATAEGRAFRCDAAPTPTPNLTTSAGAGASPGLDERLQKLKDLFDKGLITKDEYDKERATILQSL